MIINENPPHTYITFIYCLFNFLCIYIVIWILNRVRPLVWYTPCLNPTHPSLKKYPYPFRSIWFHSVPSGSIRFHSVPFSPIPFLSTLSRGGCVGGSGWGSWVNHIYILMDETMHKLIWFQKNFCDFYLYRMRTLETLRTWNISLNT